MFEGRGRRTKFRSLGKARGQGSKPDVRGQGLKHHMSEAWVRLEVRGSNTIGQRPEAKVHTPEVNVQKQRVIGQRFKQQRSEARGSNTRGLRPEVKGSNTRGQIPEDKHYKHQRPAARGQRSATTGQGFKPRGQRPKARGSNPEVRG